MNGTLALARLQAMTQHTVEPTLSSGELDVLLTYAATADEGGYEPQDDDWTPTYSAVLLNAAAAEGWRWKAGKLGAGETGSSDGASFNPEVRRQFCLDQAATYAKKVSGSAAMTGRTERLENIVGASVVLN